MLRNLGIPRYHLGIIALYILVTPVFFIRGNFDFSYQFDWAHWQIVSVVFLFILVVFLFLFRDRIYAQNLSLVRILPVVLYSALVAIPEEIIFRGIIQGYLQDILPDVSAILVSSIIFGLAHLPNGAKGLKPAVWNWKFAAYTFLAGLPLGLLFFLTNSLLVPTTLHLLFLFLLKNSVYVSDGKGYYFRNEP